MMEPYRLFFPLGMIYAVAGALLWSSGALGLIAYPATLHRLLMIQGFELSFIAGFLLTAIPGLTHSEKARAAEIAVALGGLTVLGVVAAAGLTMWAHAAALLTVATLIVAALRRVPRAATPPPVEFAFVATGLAFGAAGLTLLLLETAGFAQVGGPRFADRLLSLGMVLTLVLGLGGLLVPTFSGLRDPLEIPFIAHPHERAPRTRFYLVVIAALIAAFVLEATGRPTFGAWVRALAASAILLLVWKLPRGPGRGDLSAWAMWSAGVFTLAGLWLLALVPLRPMLGLHVVFIGGFGLLTFAIATRVVVAHGRHGLAAETRLFGPPATLFVALALGLRLVAEHPAAAAIALHGWAALAWSLAWAAWAVGALPRIARVNAAARPGEGILRPGRSGG